MLKSTAELLVNGDIDALLDFHRGLFGDARMEDAGGDGGDSGAGTDGDAGADAGTDSADGDAGADGDKPDAAADAEAKVAQARKEAADRRVELKPWKAIAKDFGLTPEQVRAALEKAPKGDAGADADGDAPDADKIRRDAVRDAEAKANARIVRAEVKALAADLFAYPDVALGLVDISKYDVDDNGDVNADDIKADLLAVLKDKPLLAKGGKAPKPDRSQGGDGDRTPEFKTPADRMRHAYAQSAKS